MVVFESSEFGLSFSDGDECVCVFFFECFEFAFEEFVFCVEFGQRGSQLLVGGDLCLEFGNLALVFRDVLL